MHDTAYKIASLFFKTYWRDGFKKILDIGSYDVPGDWSPGSLRDHAPPGSEITGVDIEAGPGVDIVIKDVEHLPFPDQTFDVITASSMFEHDTAFWITLLEMARVLKPGGFLYINAPSNGKYHRYPVDNWRFYPDAGLALEKWAVRNGQPLVMIESFTADRETDVWNDFCVVFAKSTGGPLILRELISDQCVCRNVRIHGVPVVSRETWETEDMLLLEEARRQLGAAGDQKRPDQRPQAAADKTGRANDLGVQVVRKPKADLLAAKTWQHSPEISTDELLAMSVEFRRALSGLREAYLPAQSEPQARVEKARKSRRNTAES